VFTASVANLFDNAERLVRELMSLVALGRFGPSRGALVPLQELARELRPLLQALVHELASVGGLEGLIENGLYRKRVYGESYQQPGIEPDALRFDVPQRLELPPKDR
jgi:hypothetical protein